jgi:hypothetical protein
MRLGGEVDVAVPCSRAVFALMSSGERWGPGEEGATWEVASPFPFVVSGVILKTRKEGGGGRDGGAGSEEMYVTRRGVWSQPGKAPLLTGKLWSAAVLIY